MCGTYYMCKHCLFEASEHESILSHLFETHNVKWFDQLKLTCCGKNDGLEDEQYSKVTKCYAVTSGTFVVG